jgi:predicted ATPase/GAF domain-containing protein
LCERVAARNGRFASGKFDARRSDTPYASAVDALRGLILAVAEQPEAAVAMRRRLAEALGPNGGVLTAVIPELRRLIGPQPPVPALGPTETENRFNLAFEAFLGALATPEQPLVFFLDDLHWADPATLNLIKVLASASDLRSVLLVGAFRPQEVGQDHPLRRIIEWLRNARQPLHQLALGCLDKKALTELCRDTLRCDRARGHELAALLLQKTAGNPFAVWRLLRYLQKSKLLTFDILGGTWIWDLARIEKVDISDNVVDLLIAALGKLPQATQELLQIAACIGKKLTLGLLAAVHGRPLDETARTLWVAVKEHFLTPLSAPEGPAAPSASFEYVHDRVQLAAYSLLSNERKKAIHLQIGRQILLEITPSHLDERIFEVVDQLGLGVDLVTEPSERHWLVELNLRAARKAQASSAHGSALVYLQRAMALLPEDAPHDLVFVLHRDAAQCAYASGDIRLAEQLFEAAWERAQSRFEKVDLCNVRMLAGTAHGAMTEAIEWGLKGLELLGVERPVGVASVLAEMMAVGASLKGRAIEELLNAPPMRGPVELACMEILSNLVAPAAFAGTELYAWVSARIANLSIVHGNTVHSAFGYGAYGVLLWLTGDYQRAQAFGRLGMQLIRRFANPVQECRTLLTSGLLAPWRLPLRSVAPLFREQQAKGTEAGDLVFANYGSFNAASTLFHQGVELPQVLADTERSLAFAHKTHNVRAGPKAYRQAIRCLLGLTHGRNQFDDSHFDERAFVASISAEKFLLSLYATVRLQTSYLFGDLNRALEWSRVATRNIRQSVIRLLIGAEHIFYSSLTLAACADEAPSPKRQEYLSRIEANQRELGVWATDCPENFRHKHLLVAAEVARIEGRPVEAAARYDEAIEWAAHERFLCDEALAKELAGRFYRAQGRTWIASVYLSGALQAYAHWGATAKVQALEEEFPQLEHELRSLSSAVTPSEPEGGGKTTLDLHSLLKAAESISGEIVLERVLERLMELSLATAGAERCVLIVEEEGRLMIRAVGSVAAPPSLEPVPLERSRQVPRTLLEHVRRTAEPVVLDDAASRGAFVDDPYIAEHAVKSVLAIPIMRLAKMRGILYLENNLATRVFDVDRMKVLQLLSSHIAISLENSLLFEKLTREIDERTRAEAALRFLADAGVLLVETLDYQATLAKVVRLAVPFLCEGCVIDVEKGGTLVQVAAAHIDPVKQRLLEEFSSHRAATQLSRKVMQSGMPLVVSNLKDSSLREVLSEAELPRARQVGVRCCVVVPLKARGRTIGAMGFFSGVVDRRFDARDVALAEEIAGRAAAAIDAARLYGEAQQAIELRDEFLKVASQELRTPLESLLVSLQCLHQTLVASDSVEPGTLAEQLDDNLRQAQRLQRLVDELLDTTRIEGGQLELGRSEVDLLESSGPGTRSRLS